ncbi:MAG: hypothetical protein AMXMBFR13_37220 [Phycisphaerae bacterium]
MTEIFTGFALALAWFASVCINRRRVRAFESRGDCSGDTIIFVEPVRWLFVIWGFASFCSGMRRAGWKGQLRLFRWSGTAGALLVIPDLIRRGRLLQKAERLALAVSRCIRENPERRIHLIGYSTGCYIVLEACRRLIHQDNLGQVVLLAPTVSPEYDLTTLSGGPQTIHTYYSKADLINGIGPLLFGSNDRRWGPASGTLGFRDPPGFVRQRAWRLRDVRLGYLGDHFTLLSQWFVAQEVAPVLVGGE